jgi:hypothetical protein
MTVHHQWWELRSLVVNRRCESCVKLDMKTELEAHNCLTTILASISKGHADALLGPPSDVAGSAPPVGLDREIERCRDSDAGSELNARAAVRDVADGAADHRESLVEDDLARLQAAAPRVFSLLYHGLAPSANEAHARRCRDRDVVLRFSVVKVPIENYVKVDAKTPEDSRGGLRSRRFFGNCSTNAQVQPAVFRPSDPVFVKRTSETQNGREADVLSPLSRSGGAPYLAMRRLARFCAIALNTLLSCTAC